MQVNDERLKELVTKVAKSGKVECPAPVDCVGMPNYKKCADCWAEYLKEKIW